jgi:hypothetical protein
LSTRSSGVWTSCDSDSLGRACPMVSVATDIAHLPA